MSGQTDGQTKMTSVACHTADSQLISIVKHDDNIDCYNKTRQCVRKNSKSGITISGVARNFRQGVR